MRRLHLAIPLLLTVTSMSSNPRPVRLDWGSLNILLMADSTRGTLVWAASRAQSNDRNFVAYVEPADAYTWTQELRQFLALRLTTADTGTFRASPVLRSKRGDGIYFVRLKRKDRWLDERFLVLQGASRTRGQLLIEGTERNAIEFLEALESVNMLALAMPRSQQVDTIPIANPADIGGSPVVQKNPPPVRYPGLARRDGKDGDVWLSFVVNASGAVDSSSIQVLLSDGPEFESSVVSALVRTQFTPARLGDTPVPMRVFQQFSFRIVGCRASSTAFIDRDQIDVLRKCD